MTADFTMPDEPRRIVIEKSSTVRRRYQRSNKRFQFTAEQLKRIEREEARERRAKELRDKERRRVANKKKKAEQEARDREERTRHGLPDPNVKVSSSQPLLSKFLGRTSRSLSTEDVAVDNSTVEVPLIGIEAGVDHIHNNRDIETGSVGGDTEVDTDAFDDLDEELEREISIFEDTGPEATGSHHLSLGTNQEILCPAKDDDEFSDCSAFYDENIIKEAEGVAASKSANSLCPSTSVTSVASPIRSFGDSFRDDTADLLEEVFARGCGDSFGELIQLGAPTQ